MSSLKANKLFAYTDTTKMNILTHLASSWKTKFKHSKNVVIIVIIKQRNKVKMPTDRLKPIECVKCINIKFWGSLKLIN